MSKKDKFELISEKERENAMREKFKSFKIIWFDEHIKYIESMLTHYLDLLATNKAIIKP